jgi:hypothetical protein
MRARLHLLLCTADARVSRSLAGTRLRDEARPPNAAALLKDELAKPGCREPIALGANTDPYQPIEREWKITRR